MAKICLFSGTSEGRELAFALSQYDVELTVCVTTEYGGKLSGAPRARVVVGAMDAEEMRKFFQEEKFDCIVDATHSHAKNVTQNTRTAASAAKTEYARLLRNTALNDSEVIFVSSAQEAAKYLSDKQGRVFLATGSRSLAAFSCLAGRAVARVLPLSSSLKECEAAGFTPDRIVAMQGPFDEQANEFLFERYSCHWLVTKQTGARGGTVAKIAAAKKCGMGVVVIAAPDEQGSEVSEFLADVVRKFGLKRR